MKRSRREFSAKFMAAATIEALKVQKNLAEPASYFEIHPNQISIWKLEFVDNSEQEFAGTGSCSDDTETVDTKELYSQIGRLKVKNDFLKYSLKKTGF